jgi:formylglycine-generating enzyme required for sulfatase activity
LLAKYAWYLANNRNHGWPTGSLIPNDLGLFDMLGNVFEWAQDHTERPDQVIDDINTADKVIAEDSRLQRGGSFFYPADLVRSAFRSRLAPSLKYFNDGFRPAKTCR